MDFSVANFEVLREARRKTSIYNLPSVKVGGSLARNARFGALTCVLLSFWLRRVFEGSCKTFHVRGRQSVKIGGSLARHACFEASTCVVSSF